MKVVCPYTTLHPLTRRALIEFAPDAEVVDLGPRNDSYHTLLAELWAAQETFLVIEHDIEIHAGVIPQLAGCRKPWCLFPYRGPGDESGDRHLYGSLGCTRFDKSLMVAHPDFMQALPVRDYRMLDCHILPALLALGYTQHIHWPAVAHHHVRENGICDCRSPHE